MKKKNKIDTKALQMLIKDYCGTQLEASKSIGMTESAISRAIKNPNPKFLNKLRAIGVPVDAAIEAPVVNESQNRELVRKLMAFEKILEAKEKVIEHQEKIIERLEKLLDSKKK